MALEDFFPNLARSAYTVTSPESPDYNCIAWGAGDSAVWWWPDPMDQYYWPAGVPRRETVEAFVSAYATLGFEVCEHTDLEPGFEKIAIYALPNGTPTHASRQRPNGRWTSKLGRSVDIEHALDDLEGTEYGSVVQILRKPVLR